MTMSYDRVDSLVMLLSDYSTTFSESCKVKVWFCGFIF